MCMDQVMPALIKGMHHYRMRRNVMEKMSKRNYVIGAREPIGGDKSLRRSGGIDKDERKVNEERTCWGKEAIVTIQINFC